MLGSNRRREAEDQTSPYQILEEKKFSFFFFTSYSPFFDNLGEAENYRPPAEQTQYSILKNFQVINLFQLLDFLSLPFSD